MVEVLVVAGAERGASVVAGAFDAGAFDAGAFDIGAPIVSGTTGIAGADVGDTAAGDTDMVFVGGGPVTGESTLVSLASDTRPASTVVVTVGVVESSSPEVATSTPPPMTATATAEVAQTTA